VVSTVLVSCKKESESTWAFMSRPAPTLDANNDWCPVHWWTDEEPLATYLRSAKLEWKSEFDKRAQKKQPVFHKPRRDVFAYQIISPPGKPQPTKKPNAIPNPVRGAAAQNNGAIFGAVSGLLKALHYELTALPKRVPKRKRAYVFHLAVVADAPLVDVQHEGKVPVVVRVNSMLHLARFIVAKEHMAALVYFSDASDLSLLVKSFDALSHFDAEIIKEILPRSFASIGDNDEVRDHFAKLLEARILQAANKELRTSGRKSRASEVSFRFDKAKQLVIQFDLLPEDIEVIGGDGSKTKNKVTELLRTHAHYSGEFRLDWDIPF
jgi:hypothetical protein